MLDVIEGTAMYVGSFLVLVTVAFLILLKIGNARVPKDPVFQRKFFKSLGLYAGLYIGLEILLRIINQNFEAPFFSFIELPLYLTLRVMELALGVWVVFGVMSGGGPFSAQSIADQSRRITSEVFNSDAFEPGGSAD